MATVTKTEVHYLAVLNRVRRVLYDVSGYPLLTIHRGDRLHEDLGLDSLERIETAQEIEDEFHITLSDDEVDQACMGTVGGIVDYLIDAKGVVA